MQQFEHCWEICPSTWPIWRSIGQVHRLARQRCGFASFLPAWIFEARPSRQRLGRPDFIEHAARRAHHVVAAVEVENLPRDA
jgi:hypothetical protein